ncbi:MAG: TOBE domain-containing protein [Campylobacterales bacterium]
MELEGRIWLKTSGKSFLGSGRIHLLELIGKSGSISKAAKEMGMSYKAAWDAVDAMNNLSDEPLVARNTGGKGGGGTTITPKGEETIKVFKALEKKYELFMSSIAENSDNFDALYKNLRRINMKTSARNQLFGTIDKIVKGAVNSEVELDIGGGNKIVAVITNDSVELLGFELGEEAYALIKASWIILSKEKPKKISARNVLDTKVTAVIPGAVNSEVKMGIGDKTLAAVITNEALEELKIKDGDKVYAIFKASNVILGA